MPRVLLSRIASARSGDKGEGSNVGVLAHSEPAYSFLVDALSTEVVRAHMAEINFGAVRRFEAGAQGTSPDTWTLELVQQPPPSWVRRR